MRLIDADALKKEYRMADRCEDCARNSRDCQRVYSWTLMDVCSMLDDAPTIGGWISVKDRLPDRDGEYMVYGQSEAMRELLPDNAPIWICYYCKEHGFYNIEMRREYDYITHWMPLPEPPKEE